MDHLYNNAIAGVNIANTPSEVELVLDYNASNMRKNKK